MPARPLAPNSINSAWAASAILPSSASIQTSRSPQAKAERCLRAIPPTPRACAVSAIRVASPRRGWLDHAEIGYNYRLSDMACALGPAQLSRIGEILALRQAVAERYDALFKSVAGVATPPLALPSRKISWFVYVVRLPERANRDQVQSVLFEKGIASGRYFAPIHLQPAWQDHPSARQANLPITEFIARQTLALPFFNQIAPDEQAEVAEALSNAL